MRLDELYGRVKGLLEKNAARLDEWDREGTKVAATVEAMFADNGLRFHRQTEGADMAELEKQLTRIHSALTEIHYAAGAACALMGNMDHKVSSRGRMPKIFGSDRLP